MKEAIFFESYETVVVGIRFVEAGEKVLRFKIVSAIDYPLISHSEEGEEIAEVNYFNFIGPDGEVVEKFDDSNLLVSGQFVLQLPEEPTHPLAFTIEFQSGVVYSGKELEDLVYLLKNNIFTKAFLFLTEQQLPMLEKVEVDFQV